MDNVTSDQHNVLNNASARAYAAINSMHLAERVHVLHTLFNIGIILQRGRNSNEYVRVDGTHLSKEDVIARCDHYASWITERDALTLLHYLSA